MNDRFKFRVFSKGTKELLFVLTLGGDFIKATPSLVVTSCRTLKADNCILEQCTGLKDKNGRLIYEGDIVLLDDTDSFENPIKTVVRWAEENASFGLFRSHNLYYGFYSYESENFEVIGNIHENPELLEEEKCLKKSQKQSAKQKQ